MQPVYVADLLPSEAVGDSGSSGVSTDDGELWLTDSSRGGMVGAPVPAGS
ncbi:MAG: hypothetical protein R3F59_00700 [Myxococcota bacterium]